MLIATRSRFRFFGNRRRRPSAVSQLLIPYWADGVSIGNRPTSTNWQENSGVASSRLAANGAGENGHLWHISDSPANRFMAQRISDGAGRGEWTLTGATISDIEDIASATIDGTEYLYLADFGDNANARSTINIFRVIEPTITGSDSATDQYEQIVCQYPAGSVPSHKDAEALLVDPDTGDLYIVTKRITPARCYRLAHQASYTGTQTLEYLGEIWTGPFTDDATGPSTGGYFVGGSISDDGKLVVLKNYQDVFVFVREDKQTTSIYEAMTAAPLVMEGYVGGERPSSHPNNEPKGEGVCFLANGDLITTSEYNATFGSSASAYPTFRYSRLADVPAQVSLQDGIDGYAGTADTYVWSLTTEQGNAKGTETTFVADYNSGTDERYSLLKFDLSSIPSNATIVGCDLYLYIDVEGQFFELRKMYQAWDESSTYTSLGGLPAFDDVDAASVADARHGNYDTIAGTVQIKVPVATVQDWVDGSVTNQGWVVYGTTNADGLQFRSRQHATAADRPKLVVRYTLPRKALQLFVASNQYLTRAHDAAWNLSAASGFTACGWIYRDTNGLAYFAGKYAGIGTREWILYSGASSFLTARLSADGTSSTVFNSILSISATGQWYFVALRYDPAQVGAELILNRDGLKDATAHAGGLFSGSAALRLGASDLSLADSHNGRMDAWGFWNRAMSDAELDVIRNGGRGVEYRHLTAAQRNGLIAFYDLGEASGTRADYSGNGQHLTPVGGPTNADGLVT
jgi:hypothetical protein